MCARVVLGLRSASHKLFLTLGLDFKELELLLRAHAHSSGGRERGRAVGVIECVDSGVPRFC